MNAKMIAITVLAAFVSVSAALAQTRSGQPQPQPTPQPQEPKPYGVPEGYMIIEGDIIVPVDFYEKGEPAATFTTFLRLWHDGIVPYEFDIDPSSPGYVSPSRRNAMIQAMADWEAVANVDFVPRNGQSDYIFIQDSDRNSSFVGRQGGKQVVNIFNWDREFIMAHELGHALGYWHEQSRLDRDNFIQIIWDNIPDDKKHNFQSRQEGGEYGPYDFDSVMHYSQCAFSNCSNCPDNNACPSGGRTIVVKPPFDTQWQSAIGQRNHLSVMDRLTMSFMYPEPNWRFLDLSCRCFLLNCIRAGDFFCPYDDMADAVNRTPAGGTLWLRTPGTYSALATYNKPMTIRCGYGTCELRGQ